jgi:hypothetical protein
LVDTRHGQGLRPQSGHHQLHLAHLFARPHRAETFKLSRDPLLIDKVPDIVGLYLHPPDRALVLCVDEGAEIQAL